MAGHIKDEDFVMMKRVVALGLLALLAALPAQEAGHDE